MFDRCPYFCFARGGWVPSVLTWDPVTALFARVDGPDTLTTWREADEANCFLRTDA